MSFSNNNPATSGGNRNVQPPSKIINSLQPVKKKKALTPTTTPVTTTTTAPPASEKHVPSTHRKPNPSQFYPSVKQPLNDDHRRDAHMSRPIPNDGGYRRDNHMNPNMHRRDNGYGYHYQPQYQSQGGYYGNQGPNQQRGYKDYRSSNNRPPREFDDPQPQMYRDQRDMYYNNQVSYKQQQPPSSGLPASSSVPTGGINTHVKKEQQRQQQFGPVFDDRRKPSQQDNNIKRMDSVSTGTSYPAKFGPNDPTKLSKPSQQHPPYSNNNKVPLSHDLKSETTTQDRKDIIGSKKSSSEISEEPSNSNSGATVRKSHTEKDLSSSIEAMKPMKRELSASSSSSSTSTNKTKHTLKVEDKEKDNVKLEPVELVNNRSGNESLKREENSDVKVEDRSDKAEDLVTTAPTPTLISAKHQSVDGIPIKKSKSVDEIPVIESKSVDESVTKLSKSKSTTDLHETSKNKPLAEIFEIKDKDGDTKMLDKGDEEEDTDIDESIPLPSKTTRRLHRLIRKTNSDDEEDQFNIKKLKNKKIRKSSESTVIDEGSNDEEDGRPSSRKLSQRRTSSLSSRSQSPRHRKFSGKTGKDASGRSLLQRLCSKGNYDEAKELVEAGVNINEADNAGNTPLHEAALEGYTSIVRLLLDNGAEIDIQSGHMDRDTALLDAASNLHEDTVMLLLEKGANPTLVNAQGDAALDAVDSHLESGELDDDDLATVKRLKKALVEAIREFKKSQKDKSNDGAGTDSDKEDTLSRRQQQNTFYDLFSREGRSEIYTKVADNDVSFVLTYASNLSGNNIPSDLLSLAAKHGHTEIASILLAFGAKVNATDKNGSTPLMYAVGKDHTDLVELLLNSDANSLMKDKKGRTALDILTQSYIPDEEEVNLLKENMRKRSNGELPSATTVTSSTSTSKKSSKGSHARKGKLKRKRILESESEDEGELNESEAEEEDATVEQPEKKKIKSENKKKIKKMATLNDPPVSSSGSNSQTPNSTRLPTPVPVVTVPGVQEETIVPQLTPEEIEAKSAKELQELEAKKAKELEELAIKEAKKREELEAKRIKEQEELEARRIKEQEELEAKRIKEQQELEAKKARELETRKAREALELQKMERKKARQLQIAKSIAEQEKKREEEKRKAELLELERKQREAEEEARKLNELKLKAKLEREKLELEERKRIRNYYPYVIRNIRINGLPTRNQLIKYLPIYIYKIENEFFLLDLQAILILGDSKFSCNHLNLLSRQLSSEEKSRMWNLLWPMIGAVNKLKNNDGDNKIPSQFELKKIYEFEARNFDNLIISWIKLSDFKKILVDGGEKYKEINSILNEIGYCEVSINSSNTESGAEDGILGKLAKQTSSMFLGPVNGVKSSNYTHEPVAKVEMKEEVERRKAGAVPLNFGNKAKNVMKVINKQLW